jgi:elongation factor Ts
MAEITAGMVRELREKTDAPMMECKRALTEAGGNLDKAEEILRIKLGSKASKAAGRITAEGVVATYVTDDGTTGAIVEVNCETDFVAKNEEFVGFVRSLAELVAKENPADVAALSARTLEGTSVEERRKQLVGKIGENVSLRRFQRHQARGRLASYIHGGSKIGVLVDVVGGDETLAKDIAMHIAATRPRALSPDEVPAEEVEKERVVAAAKAAESGKPANIVEKMVQGSVHKFLKEASLLGQAFVKNDKQSVQDLLKSKNASVAAFTLYVVGQGIEKRKDDFAAEVMAQVGQAGEKSSQPS